MNSKEDKRYEDSRLRDDGVDKKPAKKPNKTLPAKNPALIIAAQKKAQEDAKKESKSHGSKHPTATTVFDWPESKEWKLPSLNWTGIHPYPVPEGSAGEEIESNSKKTNKRRRDEDEEEEKELGIYPPPKKHRFEGVKQNLFGAPPAGQFGAQSFLAQSEFDELNFFPQEHGGHFDGTLGDDDFSDEEESESKFGFYQAQQANRPPAQILAEKKLAEAKAKERAREANDVLLQAGGQSTETNKKKRKAVAQHPLAPTQESQSVETKGIGGQKPVQPPLAPVKGEQFTEARKKRKVVAQPPVQEGQPEETEENEQKDAHPPSTSASESSVAEKEEGSQGAKLTTAERETLIEKIRACLEAKNDKKFYTLSEIFKEIGYTGASSTSVGLWFPIP